MPQCYRKGNAVAYAQSSWASPEIGPVFASDQQAQEARLELELYRRYSRDEAIAAVFPPLLSRLGLSSERRELCDGQWMIFPLEALCFADIGEPPDVSHFETGQFEIGTRSRWVPDKPYQVNDDRSIPSLPAEVIPAEVISGRRVRRVIRLFGRSGNTGDFIYLGTLDPPETITPGPWGHRYGAVSFALSPVIPSKLWSELRVPPFVETAVVDLALDRLHGRTTADDRFAILQTLVEYWYGPITPEDGLPEEAIRHLRMPTPLRQWYRWAGRRNIFGFHHLFSPTDLKYIEGRLLFCREHQGAGWSVSLDGDDPAVFSQELGENEPWVAENFTLTEHLLGACVFECTYEGLSSCAQAPYGAHAVSLDKAVFDQIAERIPLLAIPQWTIHRMRFYGRNGAFMVSMQAEGEESVSFTIASKSAGPLQFLKPLINEDWLHVALER
jgi:hypothetical protein